MEPGTSRASMNITGKTNAAKGVERNYNEYKELPNRTHEGSLEETGRNSLHEHDQTEHDW